MRIFWTPKRVRLAIKITKQNCTLADAARELSKIWDRYVSATALEKALVSSDVHSKDILKPRDRTGKWTKERMVRLQKILKGSSSHREAMLKIKKEFGADITLDGVRSALFRNGLSGAVCNYFGAKYQPPILKSNWTDEKIQEAVSILRKHRNIPEALMEMKNRLGIPVSYRRLHAVIKEKFGPLVSVGGFLMGQDGNTLMDDSILHLIKYIKKNRKKKLSFRGMCDEFDCSPKKMELLIADARTYGYKIDIGNDTLSLDTEIPVETVAQKVFIPSETKRQFRIGVISDTHFGSNGTLTKELQHFVNLAYDDFDVRVMLHCGDILAGDQVFKGQVAELDHWGCTKQCKAAADGLPKLDGLEYWGILGNHDISFVKGSGIDVGFNLQSLRPDFHCVGALKHKLSLNGVEVELAHLKSAAHARSYSLEKHIYRTISPNNQPQAVFCGHRHTNGYFEVQKIHTFLVPCFEDVSMFLLYHDFLPSIGGVIVDFFLDENNKIIRLSPQFFLYNIENEQNVEVSV